MEGMRVIYTGGYIPDLGILIKPDWDNHGWLCFRHPDGQWVTLADLKKTIPLVAPMDFTKALKIAQDVFEKYRQEQPKWWKRMDGTPILNDVAVRMAEAFLTPNDGGQRSA